MREQAHTAPLHTTRNSSTSTEMEHAAFSVRGTRSLAHSQWVARVCVAVYILASHTKIIYGISMGTRNTMFRVSTISNFSLRSPQIAGPRRIRESVLNSIDLFSESIFRFCLFLLFENCAAFRVSFQMQIWRFFVVSFRKSNISMGFCATSPCWAIVVRAHRAHGTRHTQLWYSNYSFWHIRSIAQSNEEMGKKSINSVLWRRRQWRISHDDAYKFE